MIGTHGIRVKASGDLCKVFRLFQWRINQGIPVLKKEGIRVKRK